MDIEQLSSQYGQSYSAEFEKAIKNYSPESSRFLEWGSGATTKIICEIAKTRENPFVLTIDDNFDYQQKVASIIPRYPFLHFRTINLQGASNSQEDTDPSYSSYPFLMGLKFDFILIDGRRRLECALVASQVASPNAIIAIHDWKRSRYKPMRALFDVISEDQEFLILKNKFNLNSLLNKKTERRVIIIPARGPRARKELEITLPRIRSYAEAVGADFQVVGEKSDLPSSRLKFEAFIAAQEYDRMLLIDADVLIRPGSPDIFDHVPVEKLGVFVEGSLLPREEWCSIISKLYRLKNPIQSNMYFNSGVMVFSRYNYHLLKGLNSEVIYGHPQYEQGFLNAQRVALDIPLFPLMYDFNFIPIIPMHPADWRFSYFYHLAGANKSKHLYENIWSDETEDRLTFTRRPFLSAEVRYTRLLQASEQMDGKDVLIFDPTDFYYTDNFAMPLATFGSGVVAYFPPLENVPDENLSVYGPYVSLDKGQWVASFLRSDGSAFVYQGAILEIVHSLGNVQLLRTNWTINGIFNFTVTEYIEDIELRIYRTKHTEEFSMLRLEKLENFVP